MASTNDFDYFLRTQPIEVGTGVASTLEFDYFLRAQPLLYLVAPIAAATVASGSTLMMMGVG